ncbi:MerR family transcriptional regulator [Nocardioides maradonensis]
MQRMTIGEFAEAAGLTPKALRLYDEMGLVVPAEVDTFSGYRRYDPAQLGQARLVAQLRLVAMPLMRIRDVLDLPPEARSAELASYWRQVEADHVSRRRSMAVLVEESRHEEAGMRIDEELAVEVGTRQGQGGRALMLDAVMTGARLFAVADGFGGDVGLAAEVMDVIAGYDDLHGVIDPVALLEEVVARAAAVVAGREGSGCTLTALVLGADKVAVAHVGDSRLHLVRDGGVQRLTRDHTLVQGLVDEGLLTADEALAREDRAQLNRAIADGMPPEPDLAVVARHPGDRFVLTTDGVHAVLTAPELGGLMTACMTPDEVAAAVEAAVLAAGAPDNYGVVVVDS